MKTSNQGNQKTCNFCTHPLEHGKLECSSCKTWLAGPNIPKAVATHLGMQYLLDNITTITDVAELQFSPKIKLKRHYEAALKSHLDTHQHTLKTSYKNVLIQAPPELREKQEDIQEETIKPPKPEASGLSIRNISPELEHNTPSESLETISPDHIPETQVVVEPPKEKKQPQVDETWKSRFKLPAELKPQQKKQSSGIRNESLAWMLGAILTIIGTFYTASATWQFLSPLFQNIVVLLLILSYAAGFSSVGRLLHKKHNSQFGSGVLSVLSLSLWPAASIPLASLADISLFAALLSIAFTAFCALRIIKNTGLWFLSETLPWFTPNYIILSLLPGTFALFTTMTGFAHVALAYASLIPAFLNLIHHHTQLRSNDKTTLGLTAYAYGICLATALLNNESSSLLFALPMPIFLALALIYSDKTLHRWQGLERLYLGSFLAAAALVLTFSPLVMATSQIFMGPASPIPFLAFALAAINSLIIAKIYKKKAFQLVAQVLLCFAWWLVPLSFFPSIEQVLRWIHTSAIPLSGSATFAIYSLPTLLIAMTSLRSAKKPSIRGSASLSLFSALFALISCLSIIPSQHWISSIAPATIFIACHWLYKQTGNTLLTWMASGSFILSCILLVLGTNMAPVYQSGLLVLFSLAAVFFYRELQRKTLLPLAKPWTWTALTLLGIALLVPILECLSGGSPWHILLATFIVMLTYSSNIITSHRPARLFALGSAALLTILCLVLTAQNGLQPAPSISIILLSGLFAYHAFLQQSPLASSMAMLVFLLAYSLSPGLGQSSFTYISQQFSLLLGYGGAPLPIPWRASGWVGVAAAWVIFQKLLSVQNRQDFAAHLSKGTQLLFLLLSLFTLVESDARLGLVLLPLIALLCHGQYRLSQQWYLPHGLGFLLGAWLYKAAVLCAIPMPLTALGLIALASLFLKLAPSHAQRFVAIAYIYSGLAFLLFQPLFLGISSVDPLCLALGTFCLRLALGPQSLSNTFVILTIFLSLFTATSAPAISTLSTHLICTGLLLAEAYRQKHTKALWGGLLLSLITYVQLINLLPGAISQLFNALPNSGPLGDIAYLTLPVLAFLFCLRRLWHPGHKTQNILQGIILAVLSLMALLLVGDTLTTLAIAPLLLGLSLREQRRSSELYPALLIHSFTLLIQWHFAAIFDLSPMASSAILLPSLLFMFRSSSPLKLWACWIHLALFVTSLLLSPSLGSLTFSFAFLLLPISAVAIYQRSKKALSFNLALASAAITISAISLLTFHLAPLLVSCLLSLFLSGLLALNRQKSAVPLTIWALFALGAALAGHLYTLSQGLAINPLNSGMLAASALSLSLFSPFSFLVYVGAGALSYCCAFLLPFPWWIAALCSPMSLLITNFILSRHTQQIEGYRGFSKHLGIATFILLLLCAPIGIMQGSLVLQALVLITSLGCASLAYLISGHRLGLGFSLLFSGAIAINSQSLPLSIALNSLLLLGTYAVHKNWLLRVKEMLKGAGLPLFGPQYEALPQKWMSLGLLVMSITLAFSHFPAYGSFGFAVLTAISVLNTAAFLPTHHRLIALVPAPTLFLIAWQQPTDLICLSLALCAFVCPWIRLGASRSTAKATSFVYQFLALQGLFTIVLALQGIRPWLLSPIPAIQLGLLTISTFLGPDFRHRSAAVLTLLWASALSVLSGIQLWVFPHLEVHALLPSLALATSLMMAITILGRKTTPREEDNLSTLLALYTHILITAFCFLVPSHSGLDIGIIISSLGLISLLFTLKELTSTQDTKKPFTRYLSHGTLLFLYLYIRHFTALSALLIEWEAPLFIAWAALLFALGNLSQKLGFGAYGQQAKQVSLALPSLAIASNLLQSSPSSTLFILAGLIYALHYRQNPKASFLAAIIALFLMAPITLTLQLGHGAFASPMLTVQMALLASTSFIVPRWRWNASIKLGLIWCTGAAALSYVGILMSTGRPETAILPAFSLMTALMLLGLYGLKWRSPDTITRQFLGLGVFALTLSLAACLLLPAHSIGDGSMIGSSLLLVGALGSILECRTRKLWNGYLAHVSVGGLYFYLRYYSGLSTSLEGSEMLCLSVLAALYLGITHWSKAQNHLSYAKGTRHFSLFLPLLALMLTLAGGWPSNGVFAMAGTLYTLHYLRTPTKPLLLTSLFLFNLALATLWQERGFTDIQLYATPLGFSCLLIAHIYSTTFTRNTLNALRYGGAAIIYAASFYQSLFSPWNTLLLLALAGLGIFLGLILRIKSYLHMGTAFMLASIAMNVARFGLQHRQFWALSLTAIGLIILLAMVLWNTHRKQLLSLFRTLNAKLNAMD